MNGIMYRRFGTLRVDLDVDFDQPSRPHLITQVLACCSTPERGWSSDESGLWKLSVGARIAGLLRITACSGDAKFPVRRTCKTCGEAMELELTVDELLERHAAADGPITVSLGNDEVIVRRPTGNDQLSWQERQYADEREARNAIIRTLVVAASGSWTADSPVPYRVFDAVEKVMRLQDPLVSLAADVRCPHCGTQHPYEIDLEALALERLRLLQREVLQDVYRLVRHFHWTESQIFAIPPWRRAQYLALLRRDEDARNEVLH